MSTVHLNTKESYKDFVLYSTIDDVIHGNFTPTDFHDQPCTNQEPPHFVQKHSPENTKKKRYHNTLNERKQYQKDASSLNFRTKTGSISDTNFKSEYRTLNYGDENYDYRTRKLDSVYYFKSRVIRSSNERVRSKKSWRYRRNFAQSRVVSGSFLGRGRVVLKWSVSDNIQVDGAESRVVFR